MAWADPRTWVTAEIITAAQLNAELRDNLLYLRTVHKIKSLDETVTSSSVLQDDNDLFFSVAANQKWLIRIYLLLDGAAGDFKMGWTFPAGLTMKWAHVGGNQTNGLFWGWAGVTEVTTTLKDAGGDLSAGLSISGEVAGLTTLGIAIVGSTAGTLQMQWAQNSAQAVSTIVKAGSLLIAERVDT